jgi:glycosyltransferase involved in cell wall biosynthesis
MLSVVIPSFNEEGNIALLAQKIKSLVTEPVEIIFVDDGSTDKTLENIKKLASRDKSVRYVSFSRNFGHQSALRAGLAHAKGDAVISMDADMQHPPELIPKLVEKWREGYDIVYTVRQNVGSVPRLRKLANKWFYQGMNYLADFKIEDGAADFRLLDRKVVEIINRLPETQLFMRGFVSWCGFKQYSIKYVPAERFSGVSKYPLKKLMAFAINGITQFSVKPLRIATTLGIASAVTGTLYGLYAIANYFVFRNTTSGWTSVILTVLIMGGVQLCILGIIGEYLGKLFMQSKGRPDYIIREDNI